MTNKRGDPDGQDQGSQDEDSQKGGRPRKDPADRRSLTHGLRLSPTEKEKLQTRAEEANLNLSEYVRRQALGKPLKTDVEQETVRQLNLIGVQLKTLIEEAERGSPLEEEAEAIAAQLREVTKKIDTRRQS
jgi:hypothetical protein